MGESHRRRALAVHGYALEVIDGTVHLGGRARAICNDVASLGAQYDFFILLGGWHTKEAGPDITIADRMRDRLLALGVPYEKIVRPLAKGELNHVMPPRDTCEECVLLSRALKMPELADAEPDMIAGRAWIPRIKRIYRKLGIECGEYLPVDFPLSLKERGQEFVAGIIARRDPLGTGSWGKLFRNNRQRRTLREPHPLSCIPLLPPYML